MIDYDKYDVKRDADESQSHLCNSLNAETGYLHHLIAMCGDSSTYLPIVPKHLKLMADYMERAQYVITYLQEENEKLMKQNDSGSIKDGKAEWREVESGLPDDIKVDFKPWTNLDKEEKMQIINEIMGPFGQGFAEKDLDDPVNHPTHYTSGSIECIDFIDSCGYGLDFCLANAIKYLTRCKLKGTCEQDIRKAIWYATHAADKIQEGKYSVE